ncbi:SbcC/MukB-like Walker B domain-containing protein [Metabacillus sp. RGM 3146]|uniref:SbcC/MukB-like Walker B domain-containing protein n=1 Tax=Metabacillus sp. RGM 3146 TaxID=3401092 RepID=UPI003B993C47
MRPIKLSIAGLHSFREKQIIDFETLCDGGVFGIFGPTGSGKSSILDAMTLALYGKVERAANNTIGILNHAEDKLSVSYTFELQNGSSRKRYTVERMYKRSDDQRVKTSISRLLDETDEPVVLADKANEVNEKIYSLLGLTIDDFTRAVVLPQGKFAEFLSLKGADRRQMLQRLFHLEQYGDVLLKKLRNRMTETRSSYEKLAAEQAGLGDASKEALTAAELELKDSTMLYKKRAEEYSQFRRTFEEQQTLWNLQIEEKAYIEQLSRLETKKDGIQEQKNTLFLAEEAEGLSPYAEALQSAAENQKEEEKQLQLLKEQHEKIKNTHSAAEKTYSDIREKKEKEEPGLLARKERLGYLKQAEEEVLQHKKEHEQLTDELSAVETELAEKTKKQKDLNDLLQKAAERQKVLQVQLEENIVSSQYRNRLFTANDWKREWRGLNEQLNETEAALLKKEKELKDITAQLLQANDHNERNKARLIEKFEAVQMLFNRTASRKKDIERLQHSLSRKAAEVRNKLELERAQSIALQLKDQLEEGAPCPVCGSIHHPNPVQDNSGSEGNPSAEILLLEELQESCRNEEKTSARLVVQLEGLSDRLVKSFPFLQTSINASGLEEIEQLWKPEELENPEKAIHLLRNELKGLSQDYLEVNESAGSIINALQSSLHKPEQLEQNHARIGEEASELKKKQAAYKNQLKVMEEKWTKEFEELPMDELEKFIQEMTQKDETAEDTRKRLDTSVQFIQQKETDKKKLQEEEAETIRRQISLNEKVQSKIERITEKSKLLTEYEGEFSISEQLNKTIRILEEMTVSEKEAYKDWQDKSNQLRHMESQKTASERTAADALARVERAKQKWAEKTAETIIKEAEKVSLNLLPSEQKMRMKAEIEQYTDKVKQVKGDIIRISEKRAGQTLTEEDWHSSNKVKKEMEEFVNQAAEARGAAAKAVQLLTEKHGRYKEIEMLLKEEGLLISRLDKLQTVFKGNSFVEYIAEEQLEQVSRDASERLGILTRQRYAIEVDSQGGFIMRDDANGGVRRPVSSLSGGETFMTSLALALSLSSQIQLRGEFPLQFFFLDEGFGTLDADLLDTVVSALEKLQSQNLSVGVISHVQELRARLPKKLVVKPAEPAGKGTSVYLETL